MSKNTKQTKIFKIQGIDCPACSVMLISELEDVGVKAEYNFAKESLSIENYSNEIELILTGIIDRHGYIIREQNEKH